MPAVLTPLEGWEINHTAIDYKKLTPKDFPWATFDEDAYRNLEPDAKGFISDPLSKALIADSNLKETCIINIGVGRGKSTAARQVINHFYGLDDYVVLVLAPFKKLVERDYRHFSEFENVVHYEMLDNPDIGPDLLKTAKLHFITINTLLGNPGEDNLEITWKKQTYIRQIQQYCRDAKKKVVFVFDEIHAGIDVFTQEYALNLLAWHDITHKSYLLSATFTESSKMVIDYFAGLTEYKLKIYEVERTKFNTQSALHLMMIKGYYSSSDLSIFDPIADIINNAVEENKRVHIITAYKKLAEELCSDGDFKICKAIQKLDYNLLLGGTNKSTFNSLQSNIGTTFFTGISFENPEDVLILFLPTSDDSKAGGIFTKGKVAINQALARLRTNGDIYVVMPQPKIYILGNETSYLVRNHLVHSKPVNYFKEEEQYCILKHFYDSQKLAIQSAIDIANKLTAGNDWEERAPLKYPTFGEYVLEHGDEYLASRYESYGKGYAPYMLWAAMNDQFENTTLKSLSLMYRETIEVRLTAENLSDDLRNIFDQYRADIIALSVDDAYVFMLKKMGEEKDGRIVYIKNGEESAYDSRDNTRWPKEIKRGVVNLIFLYKTGIDEPVTEEEYVRYRMENINYEDDKASSLDKIYHQLEWLYWRFFDDGVDQSANKYISPNGAFIDENVISPKLYHLAGLIFNTLLKNDILLSRYHPFENLLRNLSKYEIGEVPTDWIDMNHEKLIFYADHTDTPYPMEKDLKIIIYKALRNIVFETTRHSKTQRDKLQGFNRLRK